MKDDGQGEGEEERTIRFWNAAISARLLGWDWVVSSIGEWTFRAHCVECPQLWCMSTIDLALRRKLESERSMKKGEVHRMRERKRMRKIEYDSHFSGLIREK